MVNKGAGGYITTVCIARLGDKVSLIEKKKLVGETIHMTPPKNN